MPKILENPKMLILEHAGKIIEQDGYKGMSIRKVAQSSGVSIGTIYNYFPTKEALAQKLMEDYWKGCYTAFEEVDRNVDAFLPKLRSMYTHLERFADTFHENWLKLGKVTYEYKGIGMKRRQNVIDRLIGILESAVRKEALVNSGFMLEEDGLHDMARFIMSNFIMMAQMNLMDYDCFERIMIKLLK